MGNNVRKVVDAVDGSGSWWEGRSVGDREGRIEEFDELFVGLREGITRIEGCEEGVRVGFIVG